MHEQKWRQKSNFCNLRQNQNQHQFQNKTYRLQQSPYVNKETCFGSHSLSFISDKILFPAFLNDL